MPRYSLIIATAVTALLWTGCSLTPPKPVYPEEDRYAVYALDRMENDAYDEAADYFKLLYEKTEKEIYRFHYLDALLAGQKYSLLESEALRFLKEDPSRKTRRYLVQALVRQKKYDAALEQGLLTAKGSEEAEDYVVVADLYLYRQEYQKSLDYYQSAYAIEPGEFVLDKIATIIFQNFKKKQEAIAYYETHLRLYGCSKFLCQRLAQLYATLRDLDGVLSVYKRLYDETRDQVIGKKIVDLYLIQKDYDALAAFLEGSRFDDAMLLELYKSLKKYEKAAKVAGRLYEETGRVDYLAGEAMLAFESGDPKDMELVKTTVRKLRTVVEAGDNHVYLNYLGYLLIDYDIDVAEGMDLVRKALELDPENPFYLDSLAWGYYKQGKFQEAQKAIMGAAPGIQADPVVLEHMSAIEQALKKQKKTDKKAKKKK